MSKLEILQEQKEIAAASAILFKRKMALKIKALELAIQAEAAKKSGKYDYVNEAEKADASLNIFDEWWLENRLMLIDRYNSSMEIDWVVMDIAETAWYAAKKKA